MNEIEKKEKKEKRERKKKKKKEKKEKKKKKKMRQWWRKSIPKIKWIDLTNPPLTFDPVKAKKEKKRKKETKWVGKWERKKLPNFFPSTKNSLRNVQTHKKKTKIGFQEGGY